MDRHASCSNRNSYLYKLACTKLPWKMASEGNTGNCTETLWFTECGSASLGCDQWYSHVKKQVRFVSNTFRSSFVNQIIRSNLMSGRTQLYFHVQGYGLICCFSSDADTAHQESKEQAAGTPSTPSFDFKGALAATETTLAEGKRSLEMSESPDPKKSMKPSLDSIAEPDVELEAINVTLSDATPTLGRGTHVDGGKRFSEHPWVEMGLVVVFHCHASITSSQFTNTWV